MMTDAIQGVSTVFQRARHAVLATAIFACVPAVAQTPDARSIARNPWDAEKLTADVVKACGVTRVYFAVERDFDGYARLKESPSITRDQHVCATRVVESWGVPIRN